MTRDYFVIDAFTGERFAGNPAAVVVDARGLADANMQAIAAEFNLSETTFVLPVDSEGDAAHVRFRWFTPMAEVDMCGHATIAGVNHRTRKRRFPSGWKGSRRMPPIPCVFLFGVVWKALALRGAWMFTTRATACGSF